jgi:hypothetical protein
MTLVRFAVDSTRSNKAMAWCQKLSAECRFYRHVCFWHLADMSHVDSDVRFTTKSGSLISRSSAACGGASPSPETRSSSQNVHILTPTLDVFLFMSLNGVLTTS